jgi:hypothetical protein
MVRRPKTVVIWDVHGAVPEELEYANKLSQSQHYARIEKNLSHKASAVLCVTPVMMRHVIEKYRVLPKTCIILPVVPKIAKFAAHNRRRSCFVYAGGNQDWQGISDMLHAIAQTPVEGHFYFFVPNPSDFERQRQISALAAPRKDMTVGTGSPTDVRRKLSSMGFGFCLRADHLLNRVAFPTKLAEYVAAGVVPILSYGNIGGFLTDGLQYVPLSRFIAGDLPSETERQSMADSNYTLLQRWRSQMSSGATALTQLLDGRTTSESLRPGL